MVGSESGGERRQQMEWEKRREGAARTNGLRLAGRVDQQRTGRRGRRGGRARKVIAPQLNLEDQMKARSALTLDKL